MQTPSPKGLEIGLDPSEIEVVMKALGLYQIHLFDELSKPNSNRVELQAQSDLTTASIKKLHKLHEKLTGKMHKEEKVQNP